MYAILVAFLSYDGKSLKASKSMEFPVDTIATVNIKYKGQYILIVYMYFKITYTQIYFEH